MPRQSVWIRLSSLVHPLFMATLQCPLVAAYAARCRLKKRPVIQNEKVRTHDNMYDVCRLSCPARVGYSYVFERCDRSSRKNCCTVRIRYQFMAPFLQILLFFFHSCQKLLAVFVVIDAGRVVFGRGCLLSQNSYSNVSCHYYYYQLLLRVEIDFDLVHVMV